jgi:hypothetical protein
MMEKGQFEKEEGDSTEDSTEEENPRRVSKDNKKNKKVAKKTGNSDTDISGKRRPRSLRN